MLRVIGALIFLVGCAGGDDTSIDLTFDPCATTTLGGAPSAAQAAAIDGAIALWREHGAPGLARETPGMIEIRFERAATAFRGLYDDEQGVVYVNGEITDRATLAIVIAHELGHAFGLPHVTGAPSVMNPGNLEVAPTDADRAALEDRWGRCP